MSVRRPKTRLFRRILVPHDFSRSADAALSVALGLAADYDGTLIVLHVIPPVYPIHGRPLAPPPGEIAAAGRRLAETVARALKGRRARRVRTAVVVGPPASCILAGARRADAIVMGTLGRTGLSHVLLGSVAERVVRHAAVPVLTVRATRRGAH